MISYLIFSEKNSLKNRVKKEGYGERGRSGPLTMADKLTSEFGTKVHKLKIGKVSAVKQKLMKIESFTLFYYYQLDLY